MKPLISLLCLYLINTVGAQDTINPFLRLTNPSKPTNEVKGSRQYIIGSTCKTCTIHINDNLVKVYPTGAFVHEISLVPGDTAFVVTASGNTKTITKKLGYAYMPFRPAEPVRTLAIESVQTFPEGNLLLTPGDMIKFKVKALPGCNVKTIGEQVLFEMPPNKANGMPGIYQGEYTISASDSFAPMKLTVTLTDSAGKKVTRQTASTFSVMSPQAPDIAITKGRLAHLEYGLGIDRLGGAKIGYLDSNISLKITGKTGTHYRIRLANTLTAYIRDDLVELQPKGSFTPQSLTANWNVYGDDKYDYVKIGLFARLPYQSFQIVNPSKLVIDIFGATSNTNWINQMQNVKEITNLYYEQRENDILRITIELKHAQHWGHQLYYQGNTLVIKVKQQPQNLSLSNLVIAVDAGHGGTNNGGVGPTGIYEKEVALALSLKIQQLLQKQGARVIMTRTKEQFVDNLERILFYRDSLPDLLLSVHLNSSADPIRVSGTGTFYRYPGFRNLSFSIYKRMLELGLKEYGNTGSFNFMLNSPTEYPNACLETVFLSNPEEEMKIIDPGFQQQVAEKIVQGVKDFLEEAQAD